MDDEVTIFMRWSRRDGGGFADFQEPDAPTDEPRVLKLVDKDGRSVEGEVRTRLDGTLSRIEFGAERDVSASFPLLPPPHWNEMDVPGHYYEGGIEISEPNDWVVDDEGAGSWVTASMGSISGKTWIPATVPLDVILHRSDHVAIWLSSFRATPDQLSFEMEARYSSDAPRSPAGPKHGFAESFEPPSMPDDKDIKSLDDLGSFWDATSLSSGTVIDESGTGLRVGISFGDKAAAYGDHRSVKSDGMMLWADAAGSGSGRHHASLHCSALPDTDVTFWVEWKRLGVERTETVVDGAMFTAAAKRAIELWKSDDPSEELPPGQSPRSWPW